MRKIKVNSKLAVRKVSRLDKIDKFGVIFGIIFMLPSITMLIIDVITNGSKML
jgi:hypothetical protein